MTRLSGHFLLGLLIAGTTLVSALAATVNTVRSCRGPLERRFVLWNVAGAWSVLAALFVLMYVVPPPWRYLFLIPYFVHLPVAIYRFTNKALLIREYESRTVASEDDEERQEHVRGERRTPNAER